MKFSPLVNRIGGEGSDAWEIHYEANLAREMRVSKALREVTSLVDFTKWVGNESTVKFA